MDLGAHPAKCGRIRGEGGGWGDPDTEVLLPSAAAAALSSSTAQATSLCARMARTANRVDLVEH